MLTQDPSVHDIQIKFTQYCSIHSLMEYFKSLDLSLSQHLKSHHLETHQINHLENEIYPYYLIKLFTIFCLLYFELNYLIFIQF